MGLIFIAMAIAAIGGGLVLAWALYWT